MVDGQLQIDATTVKPKVFETLFQPDWHGISIDTTPAYKVAALRKLTRTMTKVTTEEIECFINNQNQPKLSL